MYLKWCTKLWIIYLTSRDYKFSGVGKPINSFECLKRIREKKCWDKVEEYRSEIVIKCINVYI